VRLGASSPTHRLSGRLDLDRAEAQKLLDLMLSNWSPAKDKHHRLALAHTEVVTDLIGELLAIVFQSTGKIRIPTRNESRTLDDILKERRLSKAVIFFCEREALRGPSLATAITKYSDDVLDSFLTKLPTANFIYVLDFGTDPELEAERQQVEAKALSLREHEGYLSLVAIQAGLQRYLPKLNERGEQEKALIKQRLWFVVKNLPLTSLENIPAADLQRLRNEYGMPDLLPRDMPVAWKEKLTEHKSNDFPKTVIAFMEETHDVAAKFLVIADDPNIKETAIDPAELVAPAQLEHAASLVSAAVEERRTEVGNASDLLRSKYLKLLGYELLDINEFMTIWSR
jgi:hypothetical protein